MEVVLKRDYEGLGKAMDVVTVKNGYARNFLIPREIAVPATEGNKKKVAETKKIAEIREEKKIVEVRELAKKIEQVPCTIPVKVGEGDKIFGSVSAQEISDFLKKEGFDIDKRNVDLDEPIKQLGVYNIKINLYRQVSAKLKVWVVKEEK
ncbi:MAG TPA: 50S ribosomal protein L9 [Chitinispirillaceae bacterium]|jgi:large subunit ribosomal protein L9|nr:50S ribosomal protein L9 [Chitinispirillaceae bacterium]